MNGVTCDAVHFAVGANEASPATTQLRRTGAIDAPHAKTSITTTIQEATCNMQVASLQAATSKLQQNISQLPEKRQRGHNWAWSIKQLH